MVMIVSCKVVPVIANEEKRGSGEVGGIRSPDPSSSARIQSRLSNRKKSLSWMCVIC
jgi:hypothetical protein